MTKQSFRPILFFLICISIPLTATAQIVDIPDPNLRVAIEEHLGIAPGATITVAHMATLTELFAPNANISNITGLEAATNLTILDLGADLGAEPLINSNSISDISPLAGLNNLIELWLYDNSISDISAIAGLTDLELLDLGYNLIYDISAIAGLTNLTTLWLDDNSISDISAIAGLTDLELLDLGYNSISDISAIAGLTNLTELFLDDNSISDISAVARLTNLTELWLNDNSISDISAIAGLTNLTALWLGYNSISDVSHLVANIGLGNGDFVDVVGNPLNAISINTHIPALQGRGVEVLFDNIVAPPEDIDQTVDIPDPNLRTTIEYELLNSGAATITVANMARLTELFAFDSLISDLTGLEHAINLRDLQFRSNDITDISPIAGLTNLTQINLSHNSIADISPLTGLNELETISLQNNSISDLSPLVANRGLGNGDRVDVTGNPLNAESINSHIPALLSRGVIVAFDFTGLVIPEGLVQTVDIPEAYLREAIEAELDKSSGDPITAADMAQLIYLYADTYYLSDLTGLEHATNLKELYLQDNWISDISPLSDLTNLTKLELGANSISDISSLTGLTNLTELELWGNSISDISVLAGLTNLTVLYLGENPISDISPLAKLTKLTELGIWGNSISDISHLAGLTNLIVLYLGDNSISDISPLAGLTKLTELDLASNSISDISAVVGLANLTYSDLSENSITDISPIAELANLQYLELGGNNITDISPIAGLIELIALDLSSNSISDISALAELTNLSALWLASNSIFDLSPLVANTGLGGAAMVDGSIVIDMIIVHANPLNFSSINIHIPTLQNRGVNIWFDNIVENPADVNGDGNVNIFDLVLVASILGSEGQNLTADVNADGMVNILDLVVVAGMFDAAAAAPSASSQAAEVLTPAAVRAWLTDAQALQITDPIMERGIVVLQQLLAALTPTETQLLANYPNPFNPETWIPYRLAQDAFVTLTIYDQTGQIVRTIEVGHQTAAFYENRSQAIYWDGRNQIGEQVASGVYFYHLAAGDYSATRKMLILK